MILATCTFAHLISGKLSGTQQMSEAWKALVEQGNLREMIWMLKQDGITRVHDIQDEYV